MRGRAPPCPPGGHAGGGRRPAGEDPLVEVLHIRSRSLGGGQPVPGQQGGGPDHHCREVPRGRGQGGNEPPRGRLPLWGQGRSPGLVFMDTPGYDPVSVTGMVAGGANVVCFTTGRGSVFGSKPVPCLKLASTSDLYRRMEEDMDLDCGAVLEGGVSLAEMGRRIFEAVLATASGRRTKSEMLGLGDEEFVPWQVGAVL